MEKRSRDEAAQSQVNVTPVDTVQHCSPCSPNPDMPSGVYFRLENTEGEMGPELEELESPSAGTGLKPPGQQCSPNEGIWETGRTTAEREIFRQPQNERQVRKLLQTSLRQLRPRQNAGTRHLVNTTSSSTPVGEEKRHHLGMRL